MSRAASPCNPVIHLPLMEDVTGLKSTGLSHTTSRDGSLAGAARIRGKRGVEKRTIACGVFLPVLVLAGCSVRSSIPPREWPTTIQWYQIPDTAVFANDLTIDDEGIVWFTDRTGSRVGRLDPDGGHIELLPTPTPNSAPYGIGIGPDRNVWYAASQIGALGRVDRETRTIEEHPIPGASGGPHSLIARNGRIWFTLRVSSRFGWYDPGERHAEIYPFHEPTPVMERGPYSLFAQPGGSLWFTAMGRAALFEIDEVEGTFREVLIPAGWARRATADADHIWYSNFPVGRFGRLDPVTGLVHEYPLISSRAQPYGVVVDGQGRIWFTEASAGLLIGFDPRTESFHSIPMRPETAFRGTAVDATVRGMAVDVTRRRLWLPTSSSGYIGRVDY